MVALGANAGEARGWGGGGPGGSNWPQGREQGQEGLCKCLAAQLCPVLCCRRAFQQFYKEYVEYTCPTEDIYLE